MRYTPPLYPQMPAPQRSVISVFDQEETTRGRIAPHRDSQLELYDNPAFNTWPCTGFIGIQIGRGQQRNAVANQMNSLEAIVEPGRNPII